MVVLSVSVVFRFAVSLFWHYARFDCYVSRVPLCRFSQNAVSKSTANFRTKNLQIRSLSQINSQTKEVDFLSAPSNFLAQWSHNFDWKILGLTILSMKNGRMLSVSRAALRAAPLAVGGVVVEDHLIYIYIYIYISWCMIISENRACGGAVTWLKLMYSRLIHCWWIAS